MSGDSKSIRVFTSPMRSEDFFSWGRKGLTLQEKYERCAKDIEAHKEYIAATLGKENVRFGDQWNLGDSGGFDYYWNPPQVVTGEITFDMDEFPVDEKGS